MKVEILIHEFKGKTDRLGYTPLKDGSESLYACGLMVTGSWAGRLEQHEAFCKTPMGKYILKCEDRIDKLTEKNEKLKGDVDAISILLDRERHKVAEMVDTLEDAREVLLHYMDAPEWSGEHDEVYEKVKLLIGKERGNIKTYEYSVSTPTIWTSFDFGEVNAESPEEARLMALERLKEDFKKANDVFEQAGDTYGFKIEFNEKDVIIKEKTNG